MSVTETLLGTTLNWLLNRGTVKLDVAVHETSYRKYSISCYNRGDKTIVIEYLTLYYEGHPIINRRRFIEMLPEVPSGARHTYELDTKAIKDSVKRIEGKKKHQSSLKERKFDLSIKVVGRKLPFKYRIKFLGLTYR